MNILITGVAGFIGSHLTEKCLKEGNNVVGIDNFDSLYNISYKKDNLSNIRNNNFSFYKLDIRNYGELRTLFESNDFDVVVHLAARAGIRRSIEEPLEYESINIAGTINLLEICKDFKIKNFIFASSSSVYGNSGGLPSFEDQKTDKPICTYAASKKAGEVICYTYHHLYHIPVTCLRFFTVYGPRQRPDMAIHKFIRLIDKNKPIYLFGDGSSKRDYTYITDIIEGILLAIKKPAGYEIFNLGYGKQIELKRIIELIEKNLGKKANIKLLPDQKGEVDATLADISKSKEVLNYNPKTGIEKGIKKMVGWYNQKRLQ